MKSVKSLVLAGLLGVGVANALPLLDVEAGGLVNADIRNAFGSSGYTQLGYGGYGRLWLKLGNFRIAPFVKYENLAYSGSDYSHRIHNLQYGAVLGYKLGIVTPYVGASYSEYLKGGFSDTYAINYGLQFKLPIIPISLGIDGSWQQVGPTGAKMNINRIGVTLGLQF